MFANFLPTFLILLCGTSATITTSDDVITNDVLSSSFTSEENTAPPMEKSEQNRIVEKVKQDTPTKDTIDDVIPRCGVARTWTEDYKFEKKILKYRIFNYSPDLSPCRTRNIIRKSFRIWEEQIDVKFEESDDEVADIKLRFQYGDHFQHPNEKPFKGEGGVLAHAFPAYKNNKSKIRGELHFDEAEFWTFNKEAIVETYLGNSAGKSCVFPFIYQKKSYDGCILGDKTLKWCATTTSFDEDQQWGFCPQPELFTFHGNSGGKACQFPFRYNGVVYKSCTNINGPSDKVDGYMWCSTTYNFDADGKWGYCPNSTIATDVPLKKRQDLFYTAVHEIGHVLGFAHSNSEDSIMYDAYLVNGKTKKTELSEADISEVQEKYGKRTKQLEKLFEEKCDGTISESTTTFTTTTSPPPTTTTKKAVKKYRFLCKTPSIDAAIILTYSTYFFKGSLVWHAEKHTGKLSFDTRVRGKKITEEFIGGPGRVDAGFVNQINDSIILFKGKKYWEFSLERELLKSGPVTEIGLSKKEKIQAIVPINVEKILIFYNKFYISYNPYSKKEDGEFTFSDELQELLPPDAAIGPDVMVAKQNVVYFFKNKDAYRVKISVMRKKNEVKMKVKKAIPIRKFLKCGKV